MPNYKVFLRGTNFLATVRGTNRKIGFYTSRSVSAKNSELAELMAIDMLSGDPGLPEILNEVGDPPLVDTERVEQTTKLQPQEEFSFYYEED